MGWNGQCDECGNDAQHFSPMYDLCDECYYEEYEEED